MGSVKGSFKGPVFSSPDLLGFCVGNFTGRENEVRLGILSGCVYNRKRLRLCVLSQ